MPDATDRIRELCLALPGVTERESHGEAAWFAANGRQLATMADHHHDDRISTWVAATPGEQELLLDAHPELLFRPPYVGGRGWVGIHLDVPGVDWDLVAALVAGAHATVVGRVRSR